MYYSHYDNSFFNILSQQQHINMQIRYCSKCVHLDGLNAENTFHSSLYSV